jgi:FkbM family methyltransferase
MSLTLGLGMRLGRLFPEHCVAGNPLIQRLQNIYSVLSLARSGARLRDKMLVFCIVGFGVLALHRTTARKALSSVVNKFGEGGLVTVRFNKHDRQLAFLLREDNEADYSIAAEMLKGGYECPDFTPGEIIDGGANIGLFSILAAASFPHAKLICYEPDADNFELLSQNLNINNIDAECHRKGLWSHDTTLYYRARDSHTGNISENPEGRVPVDCIRPVIGSNCWLKLDIESSEYVVLPALMKAGAYPRWISIEIHNYSKDGHKLTDLLARHGYVLRGNIDTLADESTLCAFRTHSAA